MLNGLRRLPARLLIGLVQAYRLLLSPWIGGACRFEPTCSAYSIQALQQHGAMVGSYLTAARIVRCNPWCNGGHDPVPLVFTWRPWQQPEQPEPPPAQE